MHAKARNVVLKNSAQGWRSQYQPVMLTERGWAKLSPEIIVDLLENASHAAHYPARRVLERMRHLRWSVRATVHEGGFGDARRGADLVPHITLQVGRVAYHLHCKENQRLHLIAITH